jgi:outer membrane protein TolC
MTTAAAAGFRSMLRTSAAAVVLAAGLAGCTAGPDYVAPKTTLEPFHNVEAVSARKTAPPVPPLDQWWTGFNDPMLVTIVQRALTQNLDLAAALSRVQRARAAAAAAGAQLLPTVDLDATATGQRQSQESPIGKAASGLPGYSAEQEYTIGPAASWEIDLFGGLRRGANAAGDEAQAAEADRVGTRISVAADAADAYLQIRRYQARVAVAQDQIDTDAHLLSLVEERHRLGQATGGEGLRQMPRAMPK